MKKYRDAKWHNIILFFNIITNIITHAKNPNIVTMMMHMATRDEGAPSLLQLDGDINITTYYYAAKGE